MPSRDCVIKLAQTYPKSRFVGLDLAARSIERAVAKAEAAGVTDNVTFELRDHIYFEDFNAGTELINNVVGQAGLSIFIPFGFDYEYPR